METYCSRETNAYINFKALAIPLGPVFLRQPVQKGGSIYKQNVLLGPVWSGLAIYLKGKSHTVGTQ